MSDCDEETSMAAEKDDLDADTAKHSSTLVSRSTTLDGEISTLQSELSALSNRQLQRDTMRADFATDHETVARGAVSNIRKRVRTQHVPQTQEGANKEEKQFDGNTKERFNSATLAWKELDENFTRNRFRQKRRGPAGQIPQRRAAGQETGQPLKFPQPGLNRANNTKRTGSWTEPCKQHNAPAG